MHNRLMSNFGPFFLFPPDLSQLLHVDFFLPLYFFHWFALHFQEITYAKNSVFLVASFRDLLLNEKQKELFVSLNNEG